MTANSYSQFEVVLSLQFTESEASKAHRSAAAVSSHFSAKQPLCGRIDARRSINCSGCRKCFFHCHTCAALQNALILYSQSGRMGGCNGEINPAEDETKTVFF